MVPRAHRPLKTFQLFLPEIKLLAARKNLTALKDLLNDLSPFDLADAWSALDQDEKLLVFNLLRNEKAVKVFEILDLEDQKFLLNSLDEDVTRKFLPDVDAPDLVQVFHKLPQRTVRRMFSLIKREETIDHIKEALKFPANTAGSLMDPKFFSLQHTLTVGRALAALKASAHFAPEDPLTDLYVTDTKGRLRGQVSIGDLLRASSNMRISEIMTPAQRIQVPALADQEEVAERFRKFDLMSCPVVDEDGTLLGVVTADRILDVVQQEATEDMLKISGADAATLEAKSLWAESRLRLPWLVAAMAGQVGVSLIIKGFDRVLAQVVALATFIPLIAAMGGNVGSQSSVLVIRGLATGQIPFRKWGRTWVRQILVGAILGVVYGAALGAFAWILYGATLDHRFGILVSLGVWISMTVASSMGAAIPFLMHRFKIDPASASAPLITTLTDLLSIATYFLLALVILI